MQARQTEKLHNAPYNMQRNGCIVCVTAAIAHLPDPQVCVCHVNVWSTKDLHSFHFGMLAIAYVVLL